jgi:hypothetical protein
MTEHNVTIHGGWFRWSFKITCSICKTIGRTSTRQEAARVKREHRLTHRKD